MLAGFNFLLDYFTKISEGVLKYIKTYLHSFFFGIIRYGVRSFTCDSCGKICVRHRYCLKCFVLFILREFLEEKDS